MGQGKLLTETKLIHNHSTGSLKKNKMDFRINHQFGDIGGDFGGVHTLYGMDQSSDVFIGFDYGVSDTWMIGFGRTKGGESRLGNLQGFVKGLIWKNKKMKFTALSEISFTTMQSQSAVESINNFDNTSARGTFLNQVIWSAVLSQKFGVLVAPFYLHRNRVYELDQNGLIGASIGVQYRLSEWWMVNWESIVTQEHILQGGLAKPVHSLGFEMNSGGHKFIMHFSNAQSVGTINAAPYNLKEIGKGEFRFGFTISRTFTL